MAVACTGSAASDFTGGCGKWPEAIDSVDRNGLSNSTVPFGRRLIVPVQPIGWRS
jgi:hypothetical protein